MQSFEAQLNTLLTRAYRSIELIEEQQLANIDRLNLTIGEIHLLEAVGSPRQHPEGKTISEISEDLQISLPSVTLAINKLLKKGFVEKRRSEKDGRKVHVLLTHSGETANRAHALFHHRMAVSISEGLTEEEKNAMLRGITKLNSFLDASLHKKARSPRHLLSSKEGGTL
ncbi:MAG: MarR family winged helix-turn-helix transcriptional regulator [Hydrogeniiclostridium sp.]